MIGIMITMGVDEMGIRAPASLARLFIISAKYSRASSVGKIFPETFLAKCTAMVCLRHCRNGSLTRIPSPQAYSFIFKACFGSVPGR